MNIKNAIKFFSALTLFLIMALMPSFVLSKTHFFEHKGNRLAGHYLAPTSSEKLKPKAVLLFVHGDGATPYDAHGYYNIIWNELRKNGYAIFSWDKPGVGESQGNWLNQSMKDRQSEVIAAVKYVQNSFNFQPKNTGLIGFSQAGWVVPAIAESTHKIGFSIGVGFATNWVDQGEYYSIRKSKLAHETQDQTSNAIRKHKDEIAFLNTNPSYADYKKYEKENPMEKERFQFVMKNYKSDATENYLKISVPTLLIWGGDDENVDANHEYKLRESDPNSYTTIKIIPNATHSLLNSSAYKGQSIGFCSWLKLMWQGKGAFAEGSLQYLIDWLNNKITLINRNTID